MNELLIKQINEPPEPLKSYINDLETAQCSELVQENFELSEALKCARAWIRILKGEIS